jgi:hypothetical protein
MDERQTLALQALRELLDNPDRDKWDKLVAASRTLIKAIETGQSARQLADVIMIDRNATAAAEIATLRQKLAATEARIREIVTRSGLLLGATEERGHGRNTDDPRAAGAA